MDSSTSLLQKQQARSYYLWVVVFFLIISTFIGGLYYCTLKIDYTWRWFRVPQYFFYHENVPVKAEYGGTVDSIKSTDGKTIIQINGDDGEKHEYATPSIDIKVYEGDLVFAGDTLGSYKRWRIGILLQGLWLTLYVSFIAILFGIVLGLFTGLARISSNPAFKWLAITYIEIVRGSPLLVQIFIWYFVLGTLVNTMLSSYDISQIPPLWFGVASLATFTGAYVAEIVRSGIQSIHRGQTEASRSLGMTYAQSMYHVILPQAFRRILPPLAGQFISLIKDSSLLGIIAIRELTKATREVVTTSLQPFELWFVCALLYLVLTFTLSMLLQYLEKKTMYS
ncbi:MAG: ABC transporter permease subunit [Desulfamplus sp.]|nr:ABC transporter permease subunit [Desulfamplus sp.]MBF0257529.1 ABC transporter permease subunit [Desulfamplus sp.]